LFSKHERREACFINRIRLEGAILHFIKPLTAVDEAAGLRNVFFIHDAAVECDNFQRAVWRSRAKWKEHKSYGLSAVKCHLIYAFKASLKIAKSDFGLVMSVCPSDGKLRLPLDGCSQNFILEVL
jgi:hypothetical protein